MPSNHDNRHYALQRHSIGDIYPWSIKRIGDSYQQPFHCITGEHGPPYTIEGDSTRAYRQAEAWVKHRIRMENGQSR